MLNPIIGVAILHLKLFLADAWQGTLFASEGNLKAMHGCASNFDWSGAAAETWRCVSEVLGKDALYIGATALTHAAISIFIGGMIGAFIFGFYWAITSVLFGMHQDAFSALAVQDYKNFLRMKFEKDTLTIYPIALDRVPRRKEWRANPKTDGGVDDPMPLLVPKRDMRPRLIHDPIEIKKEARPDVVNAFVPGGGRNLGGMWSSQFAGHGSDHVVKQARHSLTLNAGYALLILRNVNVCPGHATDLGLARDRPSELRARVENDPLRYCDASAHQPQISPRMSNFGHQPSQHRPSTGGTFPATSGATPDEDSHMRWSLLAALSASPLILSAIAAFGAAPSPDPVRVSGPVTHENLTVYFIHGTSAPGKAPLTLEEALVKRAVEVRETGNVNQLEIENRGNEPVFIQAGDIVKEIGRAHV